MKNKITTLMITALILSINSFGQMFISKNAKIKFFSKAPIENIEALNSEVTSFLDATKGEIAFVGLIRSFKFRKALMEEHFNENYMESNTFPKTNFKGVISDLSKVNFTKDGTYAVKVKGSLTIHGVTKTVEAPGTITISNGKISANSTFPVTVKDYGIKVPSMYVNNIAETVDVTIDVTYDPYKKA